MWVVETEHTPMAIYRQWSHKLSKIVRNTRQPPKVKWESKRDLLLVTRKINVDDYFSKVKQSLVNLDKYFNDKVLMGINVDWYTMPTTGNVDFETRGAGLFTDYPAVGDRFSIQNTDSDRFFAQVIEAGRLCHYEHGALKWDIQCFQEWSSFIDIATGQIYIAAHNLTIPGHVSEELKWSSTNDKETHCHIVAVNKTLAFLSNYHKGAFTSGIYKEILRLLPYTLSCMIVILHCLARPLKTVTLPKCMFLTKHEYL